MLDRGQVDDQVAGDRRRRPGRGISSVMVSNDRGDRADAHELLREPGKLAAGGGRGPVPDTPKLYAHRETSNNFPEYDSQSRWGPETAQGRGGRHRHSGSSAATGADRPARLLGGDGPLLVGDELQQRRLALLGGGDAALQRRDDVAGVGDPLAVAAERAWPCRRSSRRCRSSRTSPGETGMIGISIAMEKLLNRIDRIGMRSRAAVSRSMPGEADGRVAPDVDAQVAGRASLAPMAKPRP